MRRTQTPLLLALVLSLGGSVTVADAQSAPCPMEAWLRVGWYTSVQGGPPRRVNALWSRADPVALFAALGGHERGWTAIGIHPSRVARLNTTGVPDMALTVRFEHTPNSVEGAGISTVAHLRAVPEGCMSLSSRVTNADPADPPVDTNSPTR